MANQHAAIDSGSVANQNISTEMRDCVKTFAKSKKNFQKSILKKLMPIIF